MEQNTIKDEIGKIIKLERMKKGLNQKNFAKEIGESCGLVCDWEKGRRHPTGLKMIKIIKFLNIDFRKYKFKSVVENNEQKNIS